MDRGYESFNNIAHLQEKKWNFIIRAKESYGMISNLQLPNLSLIHICSSPELFCKFFRYYTHMSPLEYRRQFHKEV